MTLTFIAHRKNPLLKVDRSFSGPLVEMDVWTSRHKLLEMAKSKCPSINLLDLMVHADYAVVPSLSSSFPWRTFEYVPAPEAESMVSHMTTTLWRIFVREGIRLLNQSFQRGKMYSLIEVRRICGGKAIGCVRLPVQIGRIGQASFGRDVDQL